MPRLATVLKDEVQRATRREFRKCAAKMKAMVIAHQASIAALEQELRQLKRKLATDAATTEPPKGDQNAFDPSGLRQYRRKLKLSADRFARLVGVSAQSIYAWEQGRVRPRPRQIAVLHALRNLSHRQLQDRLTALAD